MSDDNKDLANSLSKLNVNAAVFVPSFGGSPSSNSTVTESSPSSQTDGQAASSSVNQAESPVDDWEAAADEKMDEGDDKIDDLEDEEEEEEGASNEPEQGELKSSKKKPAIRKRARGKASESDDGVKKEHVNIVFIGHVDAGKSTIGGQLLNLTGMVDKRTLEKYEREAKEKNRESWYLSWALDTNQEERDKGKTVEVGRAFFLTEKKHFTLLDAPGHKGFVPNMIGGACQADLAILVISARKGEFETGFERGGQTREHAMLAKTSGVKHMVVLINKMDDSTVNWDESRYNECKDKLLPYLKKCGFKPEELYFMPCSGYTGTFLTKDRIPDESMCSWYRGPSFLEYIDSLPPQPRSDEGPFRLPVVDKYKDMGTVVLGKVESGSLKRGTQLLLMPNRKQVEVLQLWSDEEEVTQIFSGENVKIKLKGIEEEEVSPGFVLCDPDHPCSVAKIFDSQVLILETKSIISKGYNAVLHIHTAQEEVQVKGLRAVDKRTGEVVQKVSLLFTRLFNHHSLFIFFLFFFSLYYRQFDL